MRFVCLLITSILFSSMGFGADDPKAAIDALKTRLLRGGQPNIAGKATVAGAERPDIAFGKVKIANNFDAVDEIKKKLGGTATVFVKDGDEFIRISTNVQKDDGSRAIGTPLAHNKAYEAVSKGDSFCGEVEILGSPYNTCYEPIKADSKIIGLYYFGYKK